MKLSALAIMLLIFFSSCRSDTKENGSSEPASQEQHFPGKLAGSTIYEVNIRQYTNEGTFKAFLERMPRIKELGVDVIWLMPIFPISETNRKGPLGSYYAPANYTAVNPEFGSLEDFKAVLAKAHELGLSVILDWVPNHTGRDHPWIKEHPEFYIRDTAGNVTYESMSPTDVWWDTALLDNSNPATRKAMIEAMRFWVELGIDGFRLDHGCGDKIPLYLWEEARTTLDPMKDLFWLAECGHETFILDGSYADEYELMMRDVATGKAVADDLTDWISKDMFKYGRTHYRMTYTTNHDLNSWNGTVFERLGEGHKAFAALVFTAYGFPLIYNGQEVGLSKRLKFFERDPIDWKDSLHLELFYKQLVSLRKNNPALWAGDSGGFPVAIEQNKNVIGFMREANGNRVVGIFNLSAKAQQLEISNEQAFGDYKNYFTAEKYSLGQGVISLQPWEFVVLIN